MCLIVSLFGFGKKCLSMCLQWGSLWVSGTMWRLTGFGRFLCESMGSLTTSEVINMLLKINTKPKRPSCCLCTFIQILYIHRSEGILTVKLHVTCLDFSKSCLQIFTQELIKVFKITKVTCYTLNWNVFIYLFIFHTCSDFGGQFGRNIIFPDEPSGLKIGNKNQRQA